MEPLTVSFTCPECSQAAVVSQVQGDHCAGCGFEFKWFQPGEERTAEDYMEILTGKKHLLTLGEGGFIIAHE
ncbi:MAG: hypothetical protein ACO1SX_20025 [Actinomycetota bacterium]